MKKNLFSLMLMFALGWQLSAQTFNGQNTGTIPDGDPVGFTSTATVSNLGVLGSTHTIANVTVNITHQFVGDLEIKLIAPNNSEVKLVPPSGSNGGDNFTNTVFTDNATTSILDGVAPYTGEFKPEQALSTLNGVDANGEWKLKIVDSFNGDEGTLDSWSITFTSGTLGVVDIFSSNESIGVYPNPSNQFIKVSGLTKTEQYTIYNTVGSEMKKGTVSNNNNNQIDVSGFVKGLYFLKLENGDTIKFIKE